MKVKDTGIKLAELEVFMKEMEVIYARSFSGESNKEFKIYPFHRDAGGYRYRVYKDKNLYHATNDIFKAINSYNELP